MSFRGLATAFHAGLLRKLSGVATEVLLGTGVFGAVPFPAAAPAQTFLAADNVLGDSNYHDIVNTGSIGAAGQTWLIIATAVCTDTAGAAHFPHRIWDGTTVFSESVNVCPAAGLQITTTICAVVTPSAATTYRLSVKDRTATTGTVQTTSGVGSAANKATSITAIRLL